MENNYHSFIKPRQEMMMSVLIKFYYMYKHHPYSYICFLFAQNLSAYSDTKAVFSMGEYQPGDISHERFVFQIFNFFLYFLSLEECFYTQEIKRSEFELHLLKHIKTFMEGVLQKLSNFHISLNRDAHQNI